MLPGEKWHIRYNHKKKKNDSHDPFSARGIFRELDVDIPKILKLLKLSRT
jgi:hypothetical protein